MQIPAYTKKRRVPRAHLLGNCFPVHVSYPELSAQTYRALTIAELGLQHELKNAARIAECLKSGQKLRACLHIGPVQAIAPARVIYTDSSSMSVEFLSPPEETVQLIRDTFELELTAASLQPSQLPGKTIYTDGSAYHVELSTAGEGLQELTGMIEPLDLRFVWKRSAPLHLELFNLRDSSPQGNFLRKKVTSFIANLSYLSRDALDKVSQLLRLP